MKKLIILFIYLIFNNAYSQKASVVKGYVSFDSVPLEKVNIENISTKDYTVTNDKGFFNLNLKIGDTLYLSYLGMKDITRIIDANDFLTSNLSIIMEQYSLKLEEVVVNNNSKINALSLGIIPKQIESLTVNERKLKTAGDFKPIHLLALLGGKLDFDPILNSINGRTKQLKKNIDIEKKEAIISYLKLNYQEYINKDLKLTYEEDVNRFYYFLVENNDIMESVDNKNDIKIKFYLCNALVEFKKINEKSQDGLSPPYHDYKE